jgi:hypothetical protein
MSKKAKKINPNDLYKSIVGDNEYDKELSEIYKVPSKESGLNMPSYEVYEPYYMMQSDTLYLPTDKFGFKYALVVCDVNTRRCDAEKMKERDGKTIVRAFKAIFTRGIVKLPTRMNMDSGSEFKNDEVNTYFSDLNVAITYARINRHRQNSYVEYKNKVIGTNLFKIMALKEIESGRTSKSWTPYLSKLITLINDNLPEPKTAPKSDSDINPKLTKDNKDLIPIGSKVRVILDFPKDVATGKRLHGPFRKSDARFERKPEIVETIQLKPRQVPLYAVANHPNTLYSKQQLQTSKFI